VPPEERVAVSDNDGTLWCEKPMPIQLDFILRRLAVMAAEQLELSAQQPWKAVTERDYGWFGASMDEHYAGDDTNVRLLARVILVAYVGISVEDYEQSADGFLRGAQHPTLGRPYLECAYGPMVELLDYLTANSFSACIASGGGRDLCGPSARTCTASRASGSSEAAEPLSTRATNTAAPLFTSPKPTTSTTPRKRNPPDQARVHVRGVGRG
jgi:hypothetical protein